MSERIALQGFSQVKFFPVLQNTSAGYVVGEGFSMPWAQEMSRDPDVTESKLYADDMLYLAVKNWNGLKANITFAEMPLEMLEKLGFGLYDQESQSIMFNPEGRNLEFAVSFRCKRTDGSYRMYRMFSFVVNEIKEGAMKTKGSGNDIHTYQVSGVFSKRKLDNIPFEIHDGNNLEWLDVLPDENYA